MMPGRSGLRVTFNTTLSELTIKDSQCDLSIIKFACILKKCTLNDLTQVARVLFGIKIVYVIEVLNCIARDH